MSQELKEQLKGVSENLQSINSTLAIASKLMEAAKVAIVETVEDPETIPASISLNGEIVGVVLRPVVATLNRRKEQFLSIKEQLLTAIESEITREGGDEQLEAEKPEELVKAEKKSKKQ